MKKYLILLAIITFVNTLKAQTIEKNDSARKEALNTTLTALGDSLAVIETIIKEQLKIDESGTLSPFVYNKFIEYKFAYLSYDRSALPSQNSASLDLLDNSTQLKLSLARKFCNENNQIKSILSAGVQAKLGDGISQLFKGNIATTGTTLSLNFSHLEKGFKFRTVESTIINGKEVPTPFGIMKSSLIKYHDDFSDKYIDGFETKGKWLINRYAQVKKDIKAGKKDLPCCEKLKEQKEELAMLRQQDLDSLAKFDSLKKLSDSLKKSKSDSNYLLLSKIYLLHVSEKEIALSQLDREICTCDGEAKKYQDGLYKEQDEIEKQLTEIGLIGKDADDVAKEVAGKYQDGYYDLITKKPAWDWFKIKWYSIGFTYTRDAYTTYDSLLGLSKRFGSKDFDSWGLKISQNWFQERYQQGGFVRAWYANISYAPALINSYTDIEAQDIQKNVLAATVADTNFIFQTSKKAKDISLKPYTTTWQHSFSGAYTAMFFKNKNAGINLLFQSQFSSISKPIFNARAGLLFSFENNNPDPDKKDSKTKINFEFFLQFPDMSDVGEAGKSVWQKRVIGISTNIPFNKIFLK